MFFIDLRSTFELQLQISISQISKKNFIFPNPYIGVPGPGVTSEILSPEGSLEKVMTGKNNYELIRVIGVAGPGEPLYNNETFDTIRLVKQKFPEFCYCISKNGSLLPGEMFVLQELGISHLRQYKES